MGNSIVFTLRGPWRIPIQFDASLVMLFLIFGFFLAQHGPATVIAAIGMVLVAILLHELGHAAACVVQKIPVTRIVLHGGGGFCQHDARVTPRQTELIAIAGPLVNLALWALATLALPALAPGEGVPVTINGQTFNAPPQAPSDLYRAVSIFAKINLFLALFNLIPVLPLDGGRLLHSWLHRFVRGITANKITGGFGLVLSVLWIPLMFAAFVLFGFILLYFPSIGLHWRLFRTGMG